MDLEQLVLDKLLFLANNQRDTSPDSIYHTLRCQHNQMNNIDNIKLLVIFSGIVLIMPLAVANPGLTNAPIANDYITLTSTSCAGSDDNSICISVGNKATIEKNLFIYQSTTGGPWRKQMMRRKGILFASSCCLQPEIN